jgi:hypothetical protein
VSFANTSTAVTPESSVTVAASLTAVGATSTGAVVVGGAVVVAVVVVVSAVVVACVVVGGAVVVVVDVVVVVVVVGAVVVVARGTNTNLYVLAIVFAGCPRSEIQSARTTSRHRMSAYNGRGLIVSAKTDAGELLRPNPFGWPSGHSNPNDRCTACTRSLNRTVTFSGLIAIDTTRGAALRPPAEPSFAIQDRPTFADEGTATTNPNGAATSTTRTRTHQLRMSTLRDPPTTHRCRTTTP